MFVGIELHDDPLITDKKMWGHPQIVRGELLLPQQLWAGCIGTRISIIALVGKD